MSMQLIRISNVTVSVSNLYKVALDERNARVLLYVKDRAEPFSFSEETQEKASSLYVHLCRLIQTTQHIIPFIFFANIAIRLELLTSIHTEGGEIIVSASGHEPEVFSFASEEEAQQNFDALMHSLGIGETGEKSQAPLEQDNSPGKGKKSPRQKPARKVPDKVPRKRGRSVEATKH